MKITGIKLYRHTMHHEAKYPSEHRSVSPLDIYEDYAAGVKKPSMRSATEHNADGTVSDVFLAITTDEGIEGVHGPVDYRVQLMVALEGLAGHLIGRDPLENRLLWDILSRFERHARSGAMLMAISAVDIALWDLKGKILGQPVYKLLGGGRRKLPIYASMLGFSTEPDRAKERAAMVRDMGVKAQKWFFHYGPAAGAEGKRKNIALAHALREELGPDYGLAFDCWMGWDLAYAKEIFRELEPVAPMWVEEVFRPHMKEGYLKLKEDTSVPLSAGEHFYTRMEVNDYLKQGTFDVIQSDPEWCGGITEALKVADLCEVYGVRCIPHGHSLLPAMHVVASMPPDVSPYVEYLLNIMDKKTCFYRYDRLGKDGLLELNDTPGLGEELDFEHIISTEVLTHFEMLP